MNRVDRFFSFIWHLDFDIGHFNESIYVPSTRSRKSRGQVRPAPGRPDRHQRHQLSPGQGGTPGAGGRKRCRQIGHRLCRHQPHQQTWIHLGRPRDLQWSGPGGAFPGGDARHPRQPYQHDLPGSHDDPQPGADHRHPDGGDPFGPPQPHPRRRRSHRPGKAEKRPDLLTRKTAGPVSP